MSELQNDDSGVTFDEPEAQEVQTEQATETEINETADLAPDSPVEGEENTKDSEEGETPEWLLKKINKQTFKQRQAERERDEARKEAEELRKKYVDVEPETVQIPNIPDSWDDDYEAKIRQRDEAILRNARAEAAIAQRQQTQANAERQQQREELERSQGLQDKFRASGTKLGVDSKQLAEAESVLVNAGVTGDLAESILDDLDGPLLAIHLAANELELDDLIYAYKTSPLKAGAILEKVKAKASALKRKYSSAPAPPESLDGRAIPPKQKGLKGATYE